MRRKNDEKGKKCGGEDEKLKMRGKEKGGTW